MSPALPLRSWSVIKMRLSRKRGSTICATRRQQRPLGARYRRRVRRQRKAENADAQCEQDQRRLRPAHMPRDAMSLHGLIPIGGGGGGGGAPAGGGGAGGG